MSKRTQYGLEFYNRSINSRKINICQLKTQDGGNNSLLSFMTHLSINDCQNFIADLTGCLAGHTNVDEGFLSDSVEDINISYNYPNVIIEDILIIPMQDLKDLLQEWLEFIS